MCSPYYFGLGFSSSSRISFLVNLIIILKCHYIHSPFFLFLKLVLLSNQKKARDQERVSARDVILQMWFLSFFFADKRQHKKICLIIFYDPQKLSKGIIYIWSKYTRHKKVHMIFAQGSAASVEFTTHDVGLICNALHSQHNEQTTYTE